MTARRFPSVARGLDPRAYPLKKANHLLRWIDARVKPAHDHERLP
jgi:hypothetical protein